MTTTQMRYQIATVYSSQNWREKVSRMSDEQVVAIFYRFLKENKFDTKKVATHNTITKEENHQITLFECGMKGSYIYEER